MSTNTTQSSKLTTGKVRFSYLHVWEPDTQGEGEPKYSASLIIPKSDKATLAKINKAIEVATQEGKSKKFGNAIPKNLKTPLRDGDEERPEDEAYADCYFLSARSKNKPLLLNSRKEPISPMEQDTLYSGCYGYASLTFYAYNSNGSKGIAVALNALMKGGDGEPLGGAKASAEDFAAITVEDDDLL